MKLKSIAILAALILAVCALCACGKDEPSPAAPQIPDGLTTEAAAAYSDVLTGLAAECGAGGFTDDDTFLDGLCFARLIDFDGDGDKELLCAYESGESEWANYADVCRVYGYDGQLVELYKGSVSNFGNGDAPGVKLISKEGAVTLVEYYGGVEINYLAMSEGRFASVMRYYSDEYGDGGVTIDDVSMTYDEAQSRLNAFEEGAKVEEIKFFDYDAEGKSAALSGVLAETADTISELAAAAQ